MAENAAIGSPGPKNPWRFQIQPGFSEIGESALAKARPTLDKITKWALTPAHDGCGGDVGDAMYREFAFGLAAAWRLALKRSSIRKSLVIGIALLFLCPIFVPFAAAQTSAGMPGAWNVHGCWDGGGGCNWTETFDFNGDGTVAAQGYSDHGTWSLSGDQFSMDIVGPNNAHSVYTGVLRNGVIAGTIRYTVDNASGTFSMERSGGASAALAERLRGFWLGTATWGNEAPFQMVFNADGSFHVQDQDNPGRGWGEGVWRLDGSQITIRYSNAANTTFTGTLQGDSITGTTLDSSGHSGAFSMTRQGGTAMPVKP